MTSGKTVLFENPTLQNAKFNIPLMYNHVLWNNFLEKRSGKQYSRLRSLVLSSLTAVHQKTFFLRQEKKIEKEKKKKKYFYIDVNIKVNVATVTLVSDQLNKSGLVGCVSVLKIKKIKPYNYTSF